MTFSIVAHCHRTGQLGVAVATAVPAVGATCPYVQAGVGAVSTQSWINPHLALDALARMAQGEPARDALGATIAVDEGQTLRQVGAVDAQGRSAAWSGSGCTSWFGQIVEPHFAVQGNMLVSEQTLIAMAAAFRGTGELELDERLLRALEAGDAAGGDRRGRQSAALVVHDRQPFPWLDLRVDEHVAPVTELRRVHGVARAELLPFVQQMPSDSRGAGVVPVHVVQLLSLSPAERARERISASSSSFAR
jgi:uncharacterized Ntn-hydrolase superfamily protein